MKSRQSIRMAMPNDGPDTFNPFAADVPTLSRLVIVTAIAISISSETLSLH